MSVKVKNIEWQVKDTSETDGYYIAHPTTDADVVSFTPPTGMTATNVQDAIEEVNTNGGKIEDVKLDSTSVVTSKVANFNTVTTSRVNEICAGAGSNANGLVAMLVNLLMPVGFTIISNSSTFNPNTAYPGTTWVRVKDTFILAAGDTYAGGTSGGEATHTLSVNEMPSHSHAGNSSSNHTWGSTWGTAGNTTVNFGVSTSPNVKAYDAGIFNSNYSVGGGQAHNNMPPYVTRYVWERTL
jgi:hypothetical protein